MLLMHDTKTYADCSLIVTSSLCHYLAGPNVTMSSAVAPKSDQLPGPLLDKIWPKQNQMNKKKRYELSQQREIRNCWLHPNVPDQA